MFGPVSESAHRKLEDIALLNGTALISQATVFDGLNASYAIRDTLQLDFTQQSRC
jgi:hypothetical protein